MRVGLFFSAAAMSGAFSGLLAAAIVQMDGIRGMSGWQWIFLLEGLATICYGAVLAAILPNTAQDVRILSPAEAEICIKRLESDGPAKESNSFNATALRSTFGSPHIWTVCLPSSATALRSSVWPTLRLASSNPWATRVRNYSSSRSRHSP